MRRLKSVIVVNVVNDNQVFVNVGHCAESGVRCIVGRNGGGGKQQRADGGALRAG